jgi:hypothetical protein
MQPEAQAIFSTLQRETLPRQPRVHQPVTSLLWNLVMVGVEGNNQYLPKAKVKTKEMSILILTGLKTNHCTISVFVLSLCSKIIHKSN